MGMFDNMGKLNDKMKGALAGAMSGFATPQSGNTLPSAPAGGPVCSCGMQLAAGAKFCPSCGQPVQVSTFCANCGTQLGGAKFCPSCGTPAGGVASPQPPQSSTVPPSLQAAFASPQPATAKVGNIRKCPACGAQVPSMTAVCPDCGHEFSNVQAASSVQAFFEKLDALEQQALDAEMNEPRKNVLAAMFDYSSYSRNEAIAKKKVALIAGFPIPNSKEEILEFLILASSRVIKVSFYGNQDVFNEKKNQ